MSAQLGLAGGQLCFLHIMKTAGMTLSNYLESQFDADEICPVRMPYELARLPSEQIARYRLFRGEFGYEDISQRLAQPVIITVLRDPVERVLSLYDYWRVYSRWWPEYDDDPDQLEVRQGIRAALAGDLMYFVAGAHPRVASFANAQTRQIAQPALRERALRA